MKRTSQMRDTISCFSKHMKRYFSFRFLCISVVVPVMIFISSCTKNEKVEQLTIDRVALMPDHPSPYKMTDWYEKANHFDQYVFNLDLKGEHLPFIWIDSTQRNVPQNTFGMFTV